MALSLILIIIGLMRPNESAQALIGFFLMFILGFSILNGTLEYKVGVNETYVYGNNFTDYHWDYDFSLPPAAVNDAFLFHRNSIDVYATFQDHILGFYLIIAGAIGFILVIFGLRNTRRMEQDG